MYSYWQIKSYAKTVFNIGQFELIKIMVRFQRLADYGKSYYNDQQFKHITGQIWELKVGQYRFPCFWYEGNWVVTHGFRKKQNKWPHGELKRTKRIMDEFLASQ